MSFDGKYVSDKKTIYTLQKNVLSNEKKNIEIPFGKYDTFSINHDKKNTLINVFDSQNNKLYLFDDQKNIVKGFPILAHANALALATPPTSGETTTTSSKFKDSK